MRKRLVVANWKMNGSIEANAQLIRGLIDKSSKIERVVCPPSVYLSQVAELVNGSNIGLGAQNVDWRESGAYTGEVSAVMVAELGARYIIVGHSERRAMFGEDVETCLKKTQAVLGANVTPIFCVGESKQQRDEGKTEQTIEAQLADVIRDVPLDKIVLAYEPVWAIGTGDVATPEQAASVHQFIRELVAKRSPGAAKTVRILYGGSVNGGNARGLFEKDDIDGALVGGASLKVEDFSAICNAV